VFDPKSDQGLFSKIYDTACIAKREHEMQLVTPIYPQYSVGIDPMAYYYDPAELIEHAISGIQGDDPFFREAARLFVTPVVYGNLILCEAEGRLPQVSLIEIFDGVKVTELKKLKEALQSLPLSISTEKDAPLYIAMLDSNLAKPDDYREKILTSLHSALIPLISGNIGK